MQWRSRGPMSPKALTANVSSAMEKVDGTDGWIDTLEKFHCHSAGGAKNIILFWINCRIFIFMLCTFSMYIQIHLQTNIYDKTNLICLGG